MIPWIQENPAYARDSLLERICEPDRIIIFKVTWDDDQGNIHVNRGFRVQGNNAIVLTRALSFHPSQKAS